MATQTGPAGQVDTLDKIEEPSRYKVLMHNDNYTSMDFVVSVLQRIFYKNAIEAEAITLNIHNYGIGECGIFTREIAEAKIGQVRHEARLHGFPLRCSLEKV